MPQKWTGDIVGMMHNNRITYEELANQLGVTKAYVSMVLNGSRNPTRAQERFEGALVTRVWTARPYHCGGVTDMVYWARQTKMKWRKKT